MIVTDKKAIHLITILLFFVLILYSLFFARLSIAGKSSYMKCWKNTQGVTECGNSVPREFYNQRIRFIDNQGITRDIKEKSKTREEILAEQQTIREEEDRLIKENEKKRQMKERDDILLKTYLTIDDILNSMRSKLDITNSRINILEASLPTSKQKFSHLVRDAADAERSGKELSDNLMSKLNSLRTEIKGL